MEEQSKICSSCNAKNHPALTACWKCKAPFSQATVACSSAETPALAVLRYKGVGGWLLLFCLQLTMFNPLLTLSSFAKAYQASAQYFSQFPGLVVITVIDALLALAVLIFGVIAGADLWNVKAGAVQSARRYLMFVLGYHVISAVLPFMAGLSSAANEAMVAPAVTAAIKGMVYVAVWYSYLNVSQRVKATYQI